MKENIIYVTVSCILGILGNKIAVSLNGRSPQEVAKETAWEIAKENTAIKPISIVYGWSYLLDAPCHNYDNLEQMVYTEEEVIMLIKKFSSYIAERGFVIESDHLRDDRHNITKQWFNLNKK